MPNSSSDNGASSSKPIDRSNAQREVEIGRLLKKYEEVSRKYDESEEELRKLRSESCKAGMTANSMGTATGDLAGILRGLETSIESAVSSRQMRFDEVEKSFKTFDGSSGVSVGTWIEQFTEQADLFELTCFQRFAYAKRLMKKTAGLFIKYESKATTWTELQCELRREFANKVNSATIHRKLSERKKKRDESVFEYMYAMIASAE